MPKLTRLFTPSIEDKVHRFADKDTHQIFIEPEGLNTHELYPNGISTSLPFDVQLELVRSIKGFENAHIMRPGYAIEYDFFNPQDLKPSLETRCLNGLFFAGQINGTTGCRRFDHPRHPRALSHVYQPRRIPSVTT